MEPVRLRACVFLAEGTVQNMPDSSLDCTAALSCFFFPFTLCQVEAKILDLFPVSLASSNLHFGELWIQKLHHATSRKTPYDVQLWRSAIGDVTKGSLPGVCE